MADPYPSFRCKSLDIKGVIIWKQFLPGFLKYPGKQEFLQLVDIGYLGDLLAVFGRARHDLSCLSEK